MRGHAFRAALTVAVFALSTLLLACPLGRLRVRIPDFVTSDVRGLQLYRVDDASGALVAAGSLQFLGIETNAELGAEMLTYRQLTPDGKLAFGPLASPVARDGAEPAALEIELTFLNGLPAGWFKIASYNAYGASGPSAGQTFIATGKES